MNCQATRPERPPRANAQASASLTQNACVDRQPVMLGIGADDLKIVVLAAMVEAEPQAKPVR